MVRVVWGENYWKYVFLPGDLNVNNEGIEMGMFLGSYLFFLVY